MTEERFDEILNEMREESAPAGEIAAAQDRVRQRLANPAALACAEFRSQLAAYNAGELLESRRLLVEDHLGRCSDCRRSLAGLRGEKHVFTMPQRAGAFFNERRSQWTRAAIAAGIAVIALYAGRDRIDTAFAPSGPRATVVSVSGTLFGPASALQTGAAINEGEFVRTSAGSRAVLRLADGSRVEMNQRTELAVRAAWSGQTVRLERGDVIVEAAKQRRGHLRVATHDAEASVKGTIFAVSSGFAGSVVAVVEGSVAVTQATSNTVLAAGQRSSTSRALDQVTPQQAVAWSQESEKYYALLAALGQIEKDIAALPAPALRTEPKLLRYLPASTLAYFAIPNLNGTIRDAMRIIDQRVPGNTALNEWWTSPDMQEMKGALDRIQAVTPFLGDEVVFLMAAAPADPKAENILMLSQIQPNRAAELQQALGRLLQDHPDSFAYRIQQDLLLVSENAQKLSATAAGLGTGASSSFAAEIAARYQHGVSWLAGVDIATFGSGVFPELTNHAGLVGVSNMRHAFFEMRWGGGDDSNDATLTFQGARQGISSWLASPGTGASSEYVSQEAVAVLSASTRSPRQALDELLSSLGETGVATELQKLEADLGLSVSNDIAATFGTDFTVAVERPSLPIPGWIAVMEVLQPNTLNDSIHRLVDAYNRDVPADQQNRKLTQSQATVDGHVWNEVALAAGGLSLYWTYDRGYMIVSMDRALGVRALTVRDSGSSLTRSITFRDRFPLAGSIHHSGFMWLNTNGVLADLAGLVSSPVVKSLMGSRIPTLVTFDGEAERIHAASRTRLTSLILDLLMATGSGKQG